MTRILYSFLGLFLCYILLVSCASSEQRVKIDEIDKGSVSADVEVEQDESEDFLEEEDLADGQSDQADPVDEEASEEDESLAEKDEALEDDESLAEEDDEDLFDEQSDDEFADEDSEEVPGEVSATDENQVDQELVDEELEELLDEGSLLGQQESPKPVDETKETLESAQGTSILESAQGSSVVDIPSDPSPSTPKEEKPTAFSNEITNLEYKAFENGGTVVIETASPADYRVIENPEKQQLVVQVKDVHLPKRFERPYITKDFNQDVAIIKAYRDEQTGSARFVIQFQENLSSPPVVQREGASILVMTKTGGPPGPDHLMARGQGDQPQDMNIRQGDSPGESMGQSTGLGAEFGSDKFTGEKINLEFTNTDVRTIIEVIVERSGINLIMDEDVGGNTNVRLRDIPWDQALLVILRSKGLGYVRQGNILRVGRQETLSREAAALSDQIKNQKQAKLLSRGLKVKYIPVSYADVNQLAGKLKGFVSKEGKIAFDDRTSSLVVTDYDEYLERVMALVKALDTPPMQVEIAAKLVEAREEFVRETGINWSLDGKPFDLGSQTGNLSIAKGGGINRSGLSFDLSVETFDIFGDLTATLGLYEQQDKVKVLSQPRVVTMNKTKATIQQTTQIPNRQTVIQPNVPAVVTFSFIDLTLLLEVTPQITFNEDVILEVQLKREFPGVVNADGQRELNRRSAQTTVMVKNGSTAVIGGIYQMDDVDGNRGIPFLKDIPVIGYLFKQFSLQKTKNELLLFLKPKILKHTLANMASSGEKILFEESFESSDEVPGQEAQPLIDEIDEEPIDEVPTDSDFFQ